MVECCFVRFAYVFGLLIVDVNCSLMGNLQEAHGQFYGRTQRFFEKVIHNGKGGLNRWLTLIYTDSGQKTEGITWDRVGFPAHFWGKHDIGRQGQHTWNRRNVSGLRFFRRL